MLAAKLTHRARVGIPLSRVIVAGLALMVSACQSDNLWQGDDVKVEARQTNLENTVTRVDENHRDLLDRFNSLERLYVDLVRQVRAQDAEINTLQTKLAHFKKDPKAAMELSRLKKDVSKVHGQMKKLEDRVFSVEMADRTARQVNLPTSAPKSSTVQSGADVHDGKTATSSNEAAGGTAQTPVAQQAAPEKTFYGVHLASYRSKDQVASGWKSLVRAFGADLNGLTPLVYVQSQDGIGTFLRLIAGPLMSEQEAQSLCDRIRKNASEQYCRVSEYQGEPVE